MLSHHQSKVVTLNTKINSSTSRSTGYIHVDVSSDDSLPQASTAGARTTSSASMGGLVPSLLNDQEDWDKFSTTHKIRWAYVKL